MQTAIKNIDDYLALQPPKARNTLEKIRKTIQSVALGSEEVISYGMPAFRYQGRMLVYFAGFKNHCSLFPASRSVFLKMKNELKAFKTSVGTISFTSEKPLSAALVKKIVKIRMKENINLSEMKLANKQQKKK